MHVIRFMALDLPRCLVWSLLLFALFFVRIWSDHNSITDIAMMPLFYVYLFALIVTTGFRYVVWLLHLRNMHKINLCQATAFTFSMQDYKNFRRQFFARFWNRPEA